VLELAITEPGQVEVHRGILTQPADSLPSAERHSLVAFTLSLVPDPDRPFTPAGQVAMQCLMYP
jgi:hypothetical protein